MELLTLSIDFLKGNPMAILACVVSYMVIGMLWYGPLFGKKWAAFNNLPIPKKGEVKFSDMLEPMSTSIISAAIQSTVLGTLLIYLLPTTILEAKMIATLLWLAFTAGHTLTNYAYAAKPMQHRLIDVFFPLVTMNVMAVILFYLAA